MQAEPYENESTVIPTYRRSCAPEGLCTRRQLRKRGLRPNGHDPVAQLRYWRQGWRYAYLYDVALAAPVRPMTPGRWRSIAAMFAARMTCPQCGELREEFIATSVGHCTHCTCLEIGCRQCDFGLPASPEPTHENPPDEPPRPLMMAA
ncbi:RRQRL motif-containing zinc-binding protein [Streptomyces chartreusis]|uniref:RRQRL motif-containing zinc-binding protein n=1 Tax=Streptomyces chartreusis TaxID=1969 RepID=UPI00362C31FB